MLVELKSGETLNGHLVSCDTYMNLTLREVVQTSAEGDRFHRLAEAYVRGNNVSASYPWDGGIYSRGFWRGGGWTRDWIMDWEEEMEGRRWQRG